MPHVLRPPTKRLKPIAKHHIHTRRIGHRYRRHFNLNVGCGHRTRRRTSYRHILLQTRPKHRRSRMLTNGSKNTSTRTIRSQHTPVWNATNHAAVQKLIPSMVIAKTPQSLLLHLRSIGQDRSLPSSLTEPKCPRRDERAAQKHHGQDSQRHRYLDERIASFRCQCFSYSHPSNPSLAAEPRYQSR